jgi:hypothetical protein
LFLVEEKNKAMFKYSLLLVASFSFLMTPVMGAVMNSSNYSLQSDSVNFGGGLSNSASYSQESSFGEVSTGNSGSAGYKLQAGYQQMIAVYVSVSTSNVVLTPSILGPGGGTADGSMSVTVTTDGPAGYQLSIVASSSPALVSGANFFSDYTPAGINPDFTFSVPNTTSEFGFTAEGADIPARFKDNGSACNLGTLDTIDACWAPLTTSDQIIAQKSYANHPSGSVTTLKFRAESGLLNVQAPGVYVATSTVTAIAL